MSGKTVVVVCKCCPDTFTARVADRNRGWARFCSKSCAAYWKKYGKRRGHQTPEMRASAALNNTLRRSVRDEYSEVNRGGGFVYAGGFGPWDDHKDC